MFFSHIPYVAEFWRIEDMHMNEYEQIKALEAEIEALKDQQRMLGKKDIMEIFGKGSDFALRFLRVAKASGYGMKIGKE